jgi:Domain of unknown function (DUF4276)
VTRLYVVVEGQTEESFIRNVLAELLWGSNVHPTPILVGTPGHKGGRTSYARVKRDVLVQLKQDRWAYCSTMVDLYGLGPGFPGHPPPHRLSNIEKVRHIERAVKDDICKEVPDLRPDLRFIPYLQLHEYEAILFSDPGAFAAGINHPELQRQFQGIRDEFESPEDIDNDPETAPSKRVLAVCPTYRKVIEGTQAAAAVGIATIRKECQHFRNWLEMLEALGRE